MIFVPLLHYFKCKNQYSGNEDGMRYLLSPGKRSVPDPDGGEGAQKEEAVLTVDIWPDPWALDCTDPALRRQKVFPLTEEGRAVGVQTGQGNYQGRAALLACGGVPVLHLQRRHCVLEAAALHSGLGAVVAAEG